MAAMAQRLPNHHPQPPRVVRDERLCRRAASAREWRTPAGVASGSNSVEARPGHCFGPLTLIRALEIEALSDMFVLRGNCLSRERLLLNWFGAIRTCV